MVGGSQEPGTEQAKEGEAQADKDVLGGGDWDHGDDDCYHVIMT